MRTPDIKAVQSFWHSSPCGLPEDYFRAPDKKAALEEIRRERYVNQGRIILYGDFQSFKDKRVLEIGCGIGGDGMLFARYGARYTGVDLTEAGVRIAKENFNISGLSGQFVQANAEELPFQDNYFDHIYSFGVIHHSPSPEKITEEMYRVLKPGGTIMAMLYNRTSFYYLLEIMLVRRIFFLFCDRNIAILRKVFRIFGEKNYRRMEAYRHKLALVKKANPHPTHFEWVSMNTDDVFCPIARVYSRGEAKKLMCKFLNFKTEAWFIDEENWFLWLALGRFLPAAIKQWLESHFGWFRMIMAGKAAKAEIGMEVGI